MKILVPALLALGISFLPSACFARNIILFIGDGMGIEHVQAGRLYVHGSRNVGILSFEELYRGQAITTLPSGAVTDSATAGTALATGYQHPSNGTISTDGSGHPVPTILERAKALGWRTGIITTDDIGGATPGAFGAHEPDRGLMSEIRADYLLNDSNHPASLPNILFGGGASDTYANLASSVGYTVVHTAYELDTVSLSTSHLLGPFAAGTLTLEHDRVDGNPQPRLWQMVQRGLDLLSQESGGFFLVVEGALIDKLSHSNLTDALCPEMEQFDFAVQQAMHWIAANGEWSNTLLLVTADHETGGLNVPDDQSCSVHQVPGFTWSGTGHTAVDVPVYASWPESINGARIDNIETFFIMEDWLAGPSGQPPVITDLAIEDIKQNSAIVSWTTPEPSRGTIDCYAGTTPAASGSDAGRVTAHRFSITGLSPDTDYQVNVRCVDLASLTGTASIGFRTTSPDVDAYVSAEPEVLHGLPSGSFSALAAPGDGLTQSITEASSGVGSGLEAIFTLHTSAPVNSIVGVTLNASFTWTDRDRGNDSVQLAIFNAVGQTWEPLAVNPGTSFALSQPASYVDGSGNLRVRFVDTALIIREKKDVLTIDWLHADVVASPPDTVAPKEPSGLTVTAPLDKELTAILTWNSDSESDLAGYLVMRSGAGAETVTFSAFVPPFTDTVMTDGTYEYKVAAVDLSGNSSEWTSPVAVQLQNRYAPSAPPNLRAEAGDQQVLMIWEKSPEWDVMGYNVYLVDSIGIRTQLDESSTETSFLHMGCVNSQLYTYQVTAIDNGSLESSPSQASATPTATPKVWVESISLSLQSAGKNWKASAAVLCLVQDLPAAGATVTGDWFLDGRPLTTGASGVTDATGIASFTSPPVKTSSGTFSFQVTNVTLPGYVYDPAGHVIEGQAGVGN